MTLGGCIRKASDDLATRGEDGISRFDWYRGTVLGDWQSVTDWLQRECLVFEEVGHGRKGYLLRFEGILDDGIRLIVDADGNNGAGPSIDGSGKNAPQVAELLRSMPWPHRVTRADSAIDFEGSGVWERLEEFLVEFAQQRGLRLSTVGDWLSETAPNGRTLYIGSRQSTAYLRLYEKGKQLGESDSTWVRVELEVKPDGAQRETAATASADDLWGYAGWSRELAPILLAGFTPNVVTASRHHSTDEFRVKLIKTFRRNRSQFAEGITRYGEKGFMSLLTAVLDEQ